MTKALTLLVPGSVKLPALFAPDADAARQLVEVHRQHPQPE
jgi:hypothetical protein